MSYVVLRGRRCNTIFLNPYAPNEDKSDGSRDSFYEQLEQVFDYFLQHHIKCLLEEFSAKLGREDIFNPTNGNESPHQESNDNDVRTVNFATSKYFVLKSTLFLHRNTWTSLDRKNNKQMIMHL